MSNLQFVEEIQRRRTFAIISHPNAGKTTITEKILLFGQSIKTAGSIKGRGSGQYAKSDWMEMEKQRGISITTSVMQFPYKNNIINLLDTPGHKDFSEDTYRTLIAVDCCLMVIDGTKGVEERTLNLIEVTRLSNKPIITFVNKIDRDVRDPVELLDEIEDKLKITCIPITWPIGCGKSFKGVYHLYNDEVYCYQSGCGHTIQEVKVIKGLNNQELDKFIDNNLMEQLQNELYLIKGTTLNFDREMFLNGKISPVFFGTALGNFGIDCMLDGLVSWGPAPMSRQTNIRLVESKEKKFSGFVFKIQANMDPKHHDRIAFVRIVSGKYRKGMKLRQVRTGKDVNITDALRFLANDRLHVMESYPGDIIGLYNHGTIRIGDTFTQGENMTFIGIPNFAPEVFRRIILRNPLKQKQLIKGLDQLSEEGAIQIFRPIHNKDLIIGAMGILQFDMVVARLKYEYNVDAAYELVNFSIVRWVTCNDVKRFEEFQRKNYINLAVDKSNNLTYIAPTQINFNITQERYPDVIFHKMLG